MLLSNVHKENLVAFVVDEAHCAKTWRGCYSYNPGMVCGTFNVMCTSSVLDICTGGRNSGLSLPGSVKTAVSSRDTFVYWP